MRELLEFIQEPYLFDEDIPPTNFHRHVSEVGLDLRVELDLICSSN